MDIDIRVSDGKVIARSPYNARLPSRARDLGGKWDGGVWAFPAHAEAAVRELYRDVYGSDGTAPVAMAVVRMAFVDGSIDRWDDSLSVAGVTIARVFGRDTGAKLGDGIAVVSGWFGSGGSRKSPGLTMGNGTVVQMELPEALIERARKDEHVASVEVVQSQTERERIEAELAALTARVDELREQLAAMNEGAK